MLVRAAARFRTRRDDGSTVVSVLVVMLVLSIGALALAAIVTNTTGVLVSSRSSVQSRAAADAGLAEAVAQGRRGVSVCNMNLSSSVAPQYSVTSSCAGGVAAITSTGRGTGGAVTTTRAVYQLNVAEGTLDGALVSANGGLNVSSIYVTAFDVDGDVVLNAGSLDCNNSTEIQGDVIIRAGTVHLSNYCHIHGDVYASGNVSLSDWTRIDGSVYAMGDLTMSNSARVGGNALTRGAFSMTSGARVTGDVTAVRSASIDGSSTFVGGSLLAGGTARVNSATVTGAVTSASTSASSFYAAKVGAIRAAGSVTDLQAATVARSVTSTKTGSVQIAPDVRIGGDLTLAGTYTSWGSGPVIVGTIRQNVTGLTPPAVPTVDTPWQLSVGAFSWSDLPFDESAWGGAGFGVVVTPTCNFQGNVSAVAAINNLSAPTIVDARTCASLKLYAASFSIRTDVVFLVPPRVDGQFMKISSADGGPHLFSIISPDATLDQAPTCSGSQEIGLSDVLMQDPIVGVTYSPCTIALGQSGSNPSGWNGQVYAGEVDWGGNSSSRMALNYQEVNVPGLVTTPAGGGGPTATSGLGNLISLRDVP